MVAMRNQEAPYSGIAGLMAAQGRYGDTELLHVRPDELAGLASMGQLTVNPDTGLPEAFSFRSLLPAVGAVAGSLLLGPAVAPLLGATAGGALGAGFGSFAGGLAAGQSPTQALMGGLMSGATAGITGGLMGVDSAAMAGDLVGGTGAAAAGTDALSSSAVAAGQQAPLTAAEITGIGSEVTNAVTPTEALFPVATGPGGPTPEALLSSGTGPISMGPPDAPIGTMPQPYSAGFPGGPVAVPPGPLVAPPPLPAGGAGNPSAIPAGRIRVSGDTLKSAQGNIINPGLGKKGALFYDATPQEIISSQGLKALGPVDAALVEAGQSPTSYMDKVGALAMRPQNLLPIAKAGIGAFLEQDAEQFREDDEDGGLGDFGSTYTPRNLRLVGGEFTGKGLTEADYRRMALEGDRESSLTPFTYEEVDDTTVGLAEGGQPTGGQPTAEETDTVVEEETVDSEKQRREEEVLQKKKAASEADKFISDTVGGAALTAMVGAELGQGLVQDPAAIATPYGQTGKDFNVGTDFGFNQGGLVGLAVGGNPRNGSKKNSFTPKQEVVYSFFKEKGYPSESIAAIMGNIAVEAPTFDFTQRESGKKKGINQGMGLFQYTGGRQKDYARYLRDNDLKDSAPNQMEYFHEQISSTVPDGELPYDAGGLNRKRLQKILLGKGMGAVEERADVIREIFLRPKKGKEHIERRMEESLNMFNLIPDAELYNKGGGIGQYFEGKVVGPGDGQSDQVLFEVEGDDPDMALLSPDEYVIPADTVAMIGSGSSTAGAKKLDGFVKNIRQKATGSKKQQKPIKQGLESFLK
jgi:hypothetical protein